MINIELARKVLTIVDAGLVSGMGKPIPGKMCVEAAVCYAMGLEHGDQPTCVSPALRSMKIRLNDSRWSSDMARANGLRRLAIAQLGSAGVLDDRDFIKRCAVLAIQTCVPNALRAVAAISKSPHKEILLGKAALCENEPTREHALEARDVCRNAAYSYAAAAAYAAAAYAAYSYAAAAAYAAAAYAAYSYAAAADSYAYAAAYAAYSYAAAADGEKALADYCEGIVQILIAMKAPGCEFLHLTEEA